MNTIKTKTSKQKQSGIAHMAILGIIVILSVVGFAGYRVLQADNEEMDNAQTVQTDNQNDIEPLDSEIKSGEEVSTEDIEQTDLTASNDQEPYEPGDKSGSQVVTFTKGGANASDTAVSVALQADQQLNGTCTFTFELGNSSVTKQVDVTKYSSCSIEIPITEFPKSGTWTLNTTYGSFDTVAYGSISGITVTLPSQERTIEFTKGGGSQQGDNVVVSANMSESQSGTCTFTFSLNGTVRVEETRSITNSNRCEATIPVSEFPKSSTYNFELSFLSDNSLVSASQAPYDITVF